MNLVLWTPGSIILSLIDETAALELQRLVLGLETKLTAITKL